MPRTWLQVRDSSLSDGSVVPPKPAEIFAVVYGADWLARMCAVYGRRYTTVVKWGNGHAPIPKAVLRHISDRISNPRFSGDLRRALMTAMEREFEVRNEECRQASKWLKLILAREAQFSKPVPDPRRRTRYRSDQP